MSKALSLDLRERVLAAIAGGMPSSFRPLGRVYRDRIRSSPYIFYLSFMAR
jgi:hypothetical protein